MRFDRFRKLLELARTAGHREGIKEGLEVAYETINKSLRKKREIPDYSEDVNRALIEYRDYLEWFLIEEGYDLEAFRNKRH